MSKNGSKMSKLTQLNGCVCDFVKKRSQSQTISQEKITNLLCHLLKFMQSVWLA